jgi:hypothetical protein
MRRLPMAVSLALPCLLLTASCEDRNPVGPTSSGTLDQFVQAVPTNNWIHSIPIGDRLLESAFDSVEEKYAALRGADGR